MAKRWSTCGHGQLEKKSEYGQLALAFVGGRDATRCYDLWGSKPRSIESYWMWKLIFEYAEWHGRGFGSRWDEPGEARRVPGYRLINDRIIVIRWPGCEKEEEKRRWVMKAMVRHSPSIRIRNLYQHEDEPRGKKSITRIDERRFRIKTRLYIRCEYV